MTGNCIICITVEPSLQTPFQEYVEQRKQNSPQKNSKQTLTPLTIDCLRSTYHDLPNTCTLASKQPGKLPWTLKNILVHAQCCTLMSMHAPFHPPCRPLFASTLKGLQVLEPCMASCSKRWCKQAGSLRPTAAAHASQHTLVSAPMQMHSWPPSTPNPVVVGAA